MDIAATLEQNVAEIRADLPAMTVDELHALHAAEKAGKQRVTLISAIEERLGEIANATREGQEPPVDMSKVDGKPNTESGGGTAGAGGTGVDHPAGAHQSGAGGSDGNVAAASNTPAWLSPDYTGPLDIAQAEARNRILAAQADA